MPIFDQSPDAMRTSLLLVLLCAALAAHANRSFVVVHVDHALIREYRCNCMDQFGPDDRPTTRIVRTPGRITWHATGGLPPYTLIDQRRDEFGHVQLTVVDAAGAVAKAVAIVCSECVVSYVHCPRIDAPICASTDRRSTERPCRSIRWPTEHAHCSHDVAPGPRHGGTTFEHRSRATDLGRAGPGDGGHDPHPAPTHRMERSR
ncbi:MAG: hypothetical protein H6594_02680 [Flavobacteriales bacterium]|nr:hypothetical protein [Flavobacteriales bacterium]